MNGAPSRPSRQWPWPGWQPSPSPGRTARNVSLPSHNHGPGPVAAMTASRDALGPRCTSVAVQVHTLCPTAADTRPHARGHPTAVHQPCTAPAAATATNRSSVCTHALPSRVAVSTVTDLADADTEDAGAAVDRAVGGVKATPDEPRCLGGADAEADADAGPPARQQPDEGASRLAAAAAPAAASPSGLPQPPGLTPPSGVQLETATPAAAASATAESATTVAELTTVTAKASGRAVPNLSSNSPAAERAAAPVAVAAAAELPPGQERLTSADLTSYIVRHGLRAEVVPEVAQEALPTGQAIVKSIVMMADEVPLVVVVRGDDRVDERRVAEELQVARRRVRLARPEEVLQHSGFVVGTVPPFGHLRPLRTWVDTAVTRLDIVYGGGGDTDREVRLAVPDLLSYTAASVLDVSAASSSGGPQPDPLQALLAAGAALPLPWPPGGGGGGGEVEMVAVVAQRRRIAKLLQFVNLVPEQVPRLPADGQAVYLRKLWRSPDTGLPVEVQLIMGKTLERSLGREGARQLMDQVKVGCVVAIRGRVQPRPASTQSTSSAANGGAAAAAAAGTRQQREDVLDVVCHSLTVLAKSKDHLNKALRAAKKAGLGSPATAQELLQLMIMQQQQQQLEEEEEQEQESGLQAPLQALLGQVGGGDVPSEGGSDSDPSDPATSTSTNTAALSQEDAVITAAGTTPVATTATIKAATATIEAAAAATAATATAAAAATAATATAAAAATATATATAATTAAWVAASSAAAGEQEQPLEARQPNRASALPPPAPPLADAWQMPLPYSAIELVTTTEQVERMHMQVLAAGATKEAAEEDEDDDGGVVPSAAGVVVALDCEWEPYERHQPKTPVSILQVATRRKVYILDLLRLCGSEQGPGLSGRAPIGSPAESAPGSEPGTRSESGSGLLGTSAADQPTTHAPAGREGRGPLTAAEGAGLSRSELAVSNFLEGLMSAPGVVKIGFQLVSDLDRVCESYPRLPCFGGAPAPRGPPATSPLTRPDTSDSLASSGCGDGSDSSANSASSGSSGSSGIDSGSSSGSSSSSSSSRRRGVSAGDGAASAGAPGSAPGDRGACRQCVDVVALARALRPELVRTPQISLTKLVALVLGNPLDKAQQRSEWGRRPLSGDQVAYAATDAYCLISIYDELLGLGLPDGGTPRDAAGAGPTNTGKGGHVQEGDGREAAGGQEEGGGARAAAEARAAQILARLPLAVKRLPLSSIARAV